MAFANNTLFTAGQDTTIRVWNLNEQAGIFVSQVCGGGGEGGTLGWVVLSACARQRQVLVCVWRLHQQVCLCWQQCMRSLRMLLSYHTLP